MTGHFRILPDTGRWTIRRMVEGAILLNSGCMLGHAPSVTRCAGATSPHAGRSDK